MQKNCNFFGVSNITRPQGASNDDGQVAFFGMFQRLQVGMVFARPPGGRFMQPSIDTILVCRGLVDALAGIQVKRLIDVGSGSGPSGI